MTGINQPGDVALDAPLDVLCSYHYFSDIDLGAMRRRGLRIIGDSGAFSAMSLGKPVDREKFHEWAARWLDDLYWCASLDVIGDADASFSNWQAARRDGLELVPSIHYGEGVEQLDRLAEHGATLIGLGGMVPYSKEIPRLLRWCLQMHRHARDHHPQVRFHGWGTSSPTLADNLPWWSTDSSGFSSCFRFGTLRLWIPRQAKFLAIDLNGRDIAKHAKTLRDVYRTDWKLISRSTPQNRRTLGRVAIRSVQLYSQWLQKRQRVTAPALLEGSAHGTSLGVGTVQGPQVAAAMGPTGQTGASIAPSGLDIRAELADPDPGPDQLGPIQTVAIGNPHDLHGVVLPGREEKP